MKWFFSYARADAREVEPGKAEVDAFFRDLSHHVERLVPGAEGFLDARDVELGDLWEPTILRHLGEASVMVCLLSPSYIASPYCSREWAYFTQRAADAASRIVPVLWVRVQEPPPCIAALQFDSEQMPDSYRKRGMWYLTELRNGGQRDAYVEARSSLAQVIAKKGALPPLPISLAPPPRFEELEDLFRRKLRVPGRSVILFGEYLMQSTSPYLPDHDRQTIASAMQTLEGIPDSWRAAGAAWAGSCPLESVAERLDLLAPDRQSRERRLFEVLLAVRSLHNTLHDSRSDPALVARLVSQADGALLRAGRGATQPIQMVIGSHLQRKPPGDLMGEVMPLLLRFADDQGSP